MFVAEAVRNVCICFRVFDEVLSLDFAFDLYGS
jgi:hypothetical protein